MSAALTLALWQKQAQQQLSAVSQTADIEARLCLCHVLSVSNSYLYSYPERELTATEQTALGTLLTARLQGHPLAYLFGYWHFFDLQLEVSPSTLIPRPDTELLVEQVLSLPLPANAKVLDLGTGTGAIALALAHNKPQWQLTAVDYISEAVKLAERNRSRLNISNCAVLHSNWFAALAEQRFDLIVSNPPYIDPADNHLAALRYEPITALTATEHGLADIRHIVQQAPGYLNQHGWLYLEHGYDQADAVRELLQGVGFAQVCSKRDYGNNWRISGGCLAN
ncbi:peptide chain release factor N(5)-glutamine methyltransferase [Rheinheimera maricola]|uniref:Release factor glutamine methyltransferase n=1 Tax=Rheinheimera maricola TaxID=2793282 RepID=A0ABS7X4R8_9GAMM|nr:peptide chain release factor N(5)-glutamine methyltransferase [Rheinheimera maricola]